MRQPVLTQDKLIENIKLNTSSHASLAIKHRADKAHAQVNAYEAALKQYIHGKALTVAKEMQMSKKMDAEQLLRREEIFIGLSDGREDIRRAILTMYELAQTGFEQALDWIRTHNNEVAGHLDDLKLINFKAVRKVIAGKA